MPPALLLVKRNEHTTDRYFWAEKGLFGAQYVEENHFLFPSLRSFESPTVTVSASVQLTVPAPASLSVSELVAVTVN
jgi:hypothetical protein